MKLSEFLRSKKEEIVKKYRLNVVRKRVGYSEVTNWMTTISFDEVEIVDFDQLMEQIEEFENSFKKEGE